MCTLFNCLLSQFFFDIANPTDTKYKVKLSDKISPETRVETRLQILRFTKVIIT